MERGKAQEFLMSMFGRDDDAAVLSRRNVLAGLGLVGAAIAVPALLSPGAAEAKPMGKPADAPVRSESAAEVSEKTVQEPTADSSDATDLSSQYWRRRRRYRYWRRPRRYIVVRRRYWRRRRYW